MSERFGFFFLSLSSMCLSDHLLCLLSTVTKLIEIHECKSVLMSLPCFYAFTCVCVCARAR